MNIKKDKFKYLNNLSMEQLDMLLFADAEVGKETPEQEEFIMCVIDEIVRRENEHPTGRFRDTAESWKEFVEVYLPKTKEDEEFIREFFEELEGGEE
jgi:hypothetical protein